MKYEQLSKISESLEIFNDAKFLSLLDENTAVVQNTKTGSVHSLPFSFNDDGILQFHGENAVCLERQEAITESLSATPKLNTIAYAILKSKIDGNEEAYTEGLDYLKSLPFEAVKKTVVTESAVSIVEGDEREVLSESEKEWADSFLFSWEEKLETVTESFKSFLSYGNLFEGDEVRSETITDLPVIFEAYQNKIARSESLFQHADKVIAWFESLSEAVGNGYRNSAFSKINPLSKDWKSDLTKALVTFKKETNESFSIPEVTKVVNKKHAELFESDMQVTMGLGSDRLPGSSTGENKLNFLKLSGVFSQTDLEKLLEDFDYVLGSWPHLNESSLAEIAAARNKIDYMYRTCMIDDEVVATIINGFNSKFGRDGRDKLADPLLSAGGSSVPSNLPAQPVGV